MRRARSQPERPAGGVRGTAWAWSGALLGAVLAALLFAPAAWLADALASASGGRLLLADARGPWWRGSAVAVLSGGEGSRDATALPGRLRWRVVPRGLFPLALELRLRQPCCIGDELRLRVEPGFGRLRVAMPSGKAMLGHWPATWLSGLGTPFNTLDLGGALRLAGDSLVLESVQGRWHVGGKAQLEMLGMSSRLSTLGSLGSYRLDIGGDPGGGDGATLTLSTLEGALQLSGSGQWQASRLRFRGEARADAGSEAVLSNLLNIIGRRQGAMSVISIG